MSASNPTIVVGILTLVGIIVGSVFTYRAAKAKNQADTSATFLSTVITRLDKSENNNDKLRSDFDSMSDEMREVKDQNTQVMSDLRRQQRISEEMANYALVLIKHIETGKPPPPPEMPWTLKPYFDTEAT